MIWLTWSMLWNYLTCSWTLNFPAKPATNIKQHNQRFICIKFGSPNLTNHYKNATMSQSNFGPFAHIYWVTIHHHQSCPTSTRRVFQPSVKNIFLESFTDETRQNCRTTLVIPPRTSVATIATIVSTPREGEYILQQISRKQGSTATSTASTPCSILTIARHQYPCIIR